MATTYQTTYSFRSYADYRKFPEIKDNFDKNNLNEQINKAKEIFYSCLELFKDSEFQELIDLFKKKIKT